MATYDLGTARGIIEMQYNGKGVQDAEKDMEGLGKKSASTSDALKKTSRATGIAGLAIAGGIGLAVNSAANFEQRMSAIAAVSGAGQKQMDQLSGKALQLGKDTQFSASEAASAIEELVKAGISVPDVLNGAADAVVALAAAGSVDMPTAAAIASNSMNAFNIKAKDMNGVVDAIAGAANASAIDVTDFGESLQQVGAVAHLAGVNFHDTATAIAIMGNAGIKGSDAGTSLKTMFQRLQPTTEKQFNLMEDLGIITLNHAKQMKLLADNGLKPVDNSTKAVNDALDKLGAKLSGSAVGSARAAKALRAAEYNSGALSNSFYDATGKTKDLAKVSQVLKDALKGMTQQQKQAALNTLFGSDAIRGAAILSNAGAKGFDKMAKSMDKVSAADVAAKRMDNFKGSLEQMKGSLETAGIVTGTILLPALRSLVDTVTGVLNAFLNLSDGTQKTILFMIAAAGAILLLISGIIKVVRFVQEFIAVLKVLRIIGPEAWTAGLGPIALIVAAIAALVIIIVLLWKHSETFRNIVTGAWNAVKNAVQAVADWFQGLPAFFDGVWGSIQAGVGNLVGWIQSHWLLLVEIFLGPLGAVIAAVIHFWPQITGIFQAGLSVIHGIWAAFWGTFGGLIKAAFGLVVSILNLAWVIIKGIFLLNLIFIRNLVTTAFRTIAAVIQGAWGIIKAIVSAGANFIRGVISRVFGVIRGITSAIWNAIAGVIRAIWARIGGTVMGAVNRVRGTITVAWNTIKGVTSRIWDAIVGAIRTAVGKIGQIAGTIKSKLTDALSGAAKWLFDKGAEIIQGLIDGMTSMISKVKDKIDQVTGFISSHLPGSPVKEGPLKVLNQGYAGKQIIGMVIDGIDKMAKPLQDAVGSATAAGVAPAAAYSTPAVGSLPKPQRASRGGASRMSRLIDGELRLHESGRAFIRGVAEDVMDESADYADTVGRMG